MIDTNKISAPFDEDCWCSLRALKTCTPWRNKWQYPPGHYKYNDFFSSYTSFQE
jgi:hypothetical protein